MEDGCARQDLIEDITDDEIFALAPAGLAHPLSLYSGRNAPIDDWQRFNDALKPVLTVKFLNEWAAALVHRSRES